MKIKTSILFVGLGFCNFAQVVEQKVKEVQITSPKQQKNLDRLVTQTLDRKDIEELQPEDVGQLLQKFAGISLKSYGGLGGLKTFSFRSLGSQHTATVIDGFLIQNTQSGQLNLGQIQTSNIESVSLGPIKLEQQLPSSVMLFSNTLSLKTFEGTARFNSFKVRATSKYGSFGQVDNYAAIHMSKKRVGITLHGKFRRATGNYPFNLRIGNFTYSGTQVNNQLNELYSGISLFLRPNEMKQPIRIIYRNTYIDQGLPGAVVLYNNFNRQFLTTQKQEINLDWNDKWGLTEIRYFGSYQYDFQKYTDSSFLNSENLLVRNFFQNNATVGLNFVRKKFGDLLHFFGGIEQSWALLNFDNDQVIQPNRWTTASSVGFRINDKKYHFEGRIGHQLVHERGAKDNLFRTRSLFAPVLILETVATGSWNRVFGLSTSTTVRLPSFNDLFYAQVGNQDLNPEKVRQFQASVGASKIFRKWNFLTKSQLYFNQITDKIVAIPTKNLFVWSIQNVGIVHATGIDITQDINREFRNDWSIDLRLNYSFQRSIDRTNSNNITFGDQVAYIPNHTANGDISVLKKKFAFRFSSSFVGSRYSLNENVESNLLPSFFTADASLSYNYLIKQKHSCFIQFQVRNMFNENFTYVRNFVMPGRNYLITLNYAL